MQPAQRRDYRALPVGSLRTQRCARRFHLPQRSADVGQAHFLRAEHQADRVGHIRGIGPTDHRAAELAAPHAQQTLGLQDPHGLAQRRLAHRELTQQLVLFGEDAAVGELTQQNAPSQLVGNLLGETAELNGWF